RGFKTDYQALALLDQPARTPADAATDALAAPSLLPNALPFSRVHDAVALAWTTIAGEASFRANTPWDEAGGDSLSALHLWCLIEETLGTRLVINSLELNATPALLIAEGEKPPPSSQAPASPPPLVFFLPSADGDTPLQAQFRAAFHNQIRFEV